MPEAGPRCQHARNVTSMHVACVKEILLENWEKKHLCDGKFECKAETENGLALESRDSKLQIVLQKKKKQAREACKVYEDGEDCNHFNHGCGSLRSHCSGCHFYRIPRKPSTGLDYVLLRRKSLGCHRSMSK